jgi:branched-chain amino acid transport system ATP-binding protein
MLEVKGIDSFYGRAQVLHRLSLTIQPKEVVGLLGRNGVGKSTTLKSIAGTVTVRSGSIQFEGRELLGLPAYSISRMGVGYVPEERRIFSTLSVEENLLVGVKPAAKGRKSHWTVERFYEMYPEIKKLALQMGGHLSGGEQQILTIGRTLMGNPTLIMVDEPTEGLAPLLKERIFDMLEEIKQSGASILLVDNSIPYLMKLADRLYVISKGEIVFEGTPEEFQDNEAIRRDYLEV